MQEILDIESRDLSSENPDVEEEIWLEPGELSSESIDLDAGELENEAIGSERIDALEDAVRELQGRGNVRYDTQQNLSTEQQQRAKDNIGIAYPEETDPIFTRWRLNDYEEMEEMTIEDIDRIII